MSDKTKLQDAAVFPSMTDFNLATKTARGIVPGIGEMPEVLKPVQGAIARFAKRKGIDLNGTVQEIAASARQALAKAMPTPAIAVASKGSDYSL